MVELRRINLPLGLSIKDKYRVLWMYIGSAFKMRFSRKLTVQRFRNFDGKIWEGVLPNTLIQNFPDIEQYMKKD